LILNLKSILARFAARLTLARRYRNLPYSESSYQL
jgi:hypothetical protein